jgi:hypothetical protein
MPTKSESIKLFLTTSTHKDLADLYTIDMECQVNVAQDSGERVEGDFKGRKWIGWSDGLTTWKPFRIPFKANTEPEYTDTEIKFDLAAHAEGIGMTGWDWTHKQSLWVAFDFDAISGHSDKNAKKLDNAQLDAVRKAACDIEWVTVRKSTSGSGIHLYVFMDPVSTSNHNEHAALGRAILAKMSAITGFDFSSKVDICGQNMWVWHRKMKGTDGLIVIKQGSQLTEIPANWRDHINVVKGHKKRTSPLPENSSSMDIFDELCAQTSRTELDEEHKKLISFLKENGCQWWWDQDRWMLVCHTYDLQCAHEELQLHGIFKTISIGTAKGQDHNCFAYPMRKGQWSIRRFSPGCTEADTWTQDSAGWTKCYLNREPDLQVASRGNGGVEQPKGGFVFREAECALNAARIIGAKIDLPVQYLKRNTILKAHKDGRLIVEVTRENNDPPKDFDGWLQDKGKWIKIVNANIGVSNEGEVGNYDDLMRHITTACGEDVGWVVKREGWGGEPLTHIKSVLKAAGINPKDTDTVIGNAIMSCWKLVNKPFQPEYPGNREWNRGAAQLRFLPSETEGPCPTWHRLLVHIGRGLNIAVKENPWCKANGIATGMDYLMCWVASLFQCPTEPLPYLFLWSTEQNTGKSTFHEALSLLMTAGYQRADHALSDKTDFNGEIKNAVLCVVEETDLRKSKTASNKIKDWVTARQLNIRELYTTAYMVPNTTHWIQCNNDHMACPIFPGDTRITMIHIEPIELMDMIPKRNFLPLLEKEAPFFMRQLLDLELPESNDRLNIPVIVTDDKLLTEKSNQTPLETFVNEICHEVPGEMVPLLLFYERFKEWADPNDLAVWTKRKVTKELPPKFPYGRVTTENGQYFVGNVSFDPPVEGSPIKNLLRGIGGRLM